MSDIEIIPPGSPLAVPSDASVTKPMDLGKSDQNFKITVDMLGVLQEGEDEMFRNWGKKWEDHKTGRTQIDAIAESSNRDTDLRETVLKTVREDK